MPQLRNHPIRLMPNAARVVIRPFHIAPEPRDLNPVQATRIRRIVDAVCHMDLRTCDAELALVNRDFVPRHWQTSLVYLHRYDQIMEELGLSLNLKQSQKELIGAFFCPRIFVTPASALMNPSIVPHPDQSWLAEGELRFILSLRTVGEGHISSIAFREGVLAADGGMSLLPEPAIRGRRRHRRTSAGEIPRARRSAPASRDLALGHRDLSGDRTGTAQRPGGFAPAQVRGGSEPCYYGTYTAYSGMSIASELLVTEDFPGVSSSNRMSGGGPRATRAWRSSPGRSAASTR